MRCIEMVTQAEIAENANAININMRCIEIRQIPFKFNFTNRLTLT